MSQTVPPNDRTPRARTEGLVTTQAGQRHFVYDAAAHEVHQLNAVAMAVWRRCDGTHTVKSMARTAAVELGEPIGEETVRLALQKLGDAGMLTEPVDRPAGVSRRSLMKKAAVAGAVAVPVVISTTAPAAAQPSGEGFAIESQATYLCTVTYTVTGGVVRKGDDTCVEAGRGLCGGAAGIVWEYDDSGTLAGGTFEGECNVDPPAPVTPSLPELNTVPETDDSDDGDDLTTTVDKTEESEPEEPKTEESPPEAEPKTEEIPAEPKPTEPEVSGDTTSLSTTSDPDAEPQSTEPDAGEG